jgi:hypothetical protein
MRLRIVRTARLPMRRLVMATLAFAVLGSLGAADRSTSAVGTAAGRSRILYASNWTGHMQIYAVDPSGRARGVQKLDRHAAAAMSTRG